MSDEAKKLQLIKEIIKIEDDKVLRAVESVISETNSSITGRKSFKEFQGVLTDEEVTELENTINNGCENIYPDDWK